MAIVVGVRFRPVGKIYYFDAGEFDIELDDYVIVETTRGTEAGRVVIAPRQIVQNDSQEPLKPIIRLADDEDLRAMRHFKSREKDVLLTTERKIRQFKLPMKLVSAEYNFDGSRLTIQFAAENRVDFRELVRDLATTFHARIELRQVGPRDQAKAIGGIGRCGQQTCCSRFAPEFPNVSMKMAKNQDLPLNPDKLSGVCGKQLCCLSYEDGGYCTLKKGMPQAGDTVATQAGQGLVLVVHTLKEMATIELENGTRVQVPTAEMTVLADIPRVMPQRQRRGGRPPGPSAN